MKANSNSKGELLSSSCVWTMPELQAYQLWDPDTGSDLSPAVVWPLGKDHVSLGMGLGRTKACLMMSTSSIGLSKFWGSKQDKL